MKIRKHLFLILSLLFFCTAALCGCGEKNVAEVNGEAITKSAFNSYWDNLGKIYDANGETLESEMKEVVAEQLVYDTLLQQAAEELHCVPAEADADAYYQEQLAEDYGSTDAAAELMDTYGLDDDFFYYQYRCRLLEKRIIEVLAEDTPIAVSEEEAQGIYDENPGLYDFRVVSHILISPYAADDRTLSADADGNTVYTEEEWAAAKERADKIIAELDNGETFSLLALKYSDDDATANNGGIIDDVIYRNGEGYTEDFRTAAFALKTSGSYSKTPLKTEKGYEILYCRDVISPEDMDGVLAYISEQKEAEKGNALLSSYMEERKAAADIQYHSENWK